MPNWRDLVQISLLFLCVPAQYLISTQWGSSNSGERDEFLQRLFVVTKNLLNDCTSLDFWNNVLLDAHKFILLKTKRDTRSVRVYPTTGESPALEVKYYRENQVEYFANSKQPRFSKPDKVKFRIGQVVRHKILGYRGVIIGWDAVAKAPKKWLQTMYPSYREYWKYMPNYVVLVDVRDRKEPQMTYVPQENLEVLKNVEVKHPDIDDYFMAFMGDIYIAHRWLRQMYPAD